MGEKGILLAGWGEGEGEGGIRGRPEGSESHITSGSRGGVRPPPTPYLNLRNENKKKHGMKIKK